MEETNKEFSPKSFKWKFYSIGWLFGFWNLFFWLWQYIMHFGDEDEDKFFSVYFYQRVCYWGIFCTILIGIAFVLMFIF